MIYRFLVSTVLLVLVGITIGCNNDVWEHSLDSPEAIGQAVIEALNRGDAAGLHRLRVGRDDYLSWLWPTFPSSRPPYNFPPDFAWSNLNKQCAIGVEKWIRRYGNMNLTLVDIRFEHPTEKYRGFRLLRGTVLTVQTTDGKKVELRLLGSVVEKGARYKLMSYKD